MRCVKILVEEYESRIDAPGKVTSAGVYISGAPALWCAIEGGHAHVVAYLLGKGANPNITTGYKTTPMSSASSNNHVHIAKILIQYGAEVDVANCRGVTGLMLASSNGHSEAVEFLLKAGADVNKRSLDGKSAVYACASSGQLKVLKMLLDRNARLVADYYGITPLIAACAAGHVHIAEYLLNKTNLIPTKEKIDAMELLGAIFANQEEDMMAIQYWKNAMRDRYVNGVLVYPKAQPPVQHGDFREFTTMEELQGLEMNREEMQVQSLLVRIRILGPEHSDTMLGFRDKGLAYADNGEFKRCYDLWMLALCTRQRRPSPLSDGRLFHLNSLIGLYTHVINRSPENARNTWPVTHFEDLLRLFETVTGDVELVMSKLRKPVDNGRRTYYSRLYNVITLLMHLLLSLTKLQPNLKTVQWIAAKREVYKLVKAKPRNSLGSTLLHLACSTCLQINSELVPSLIFPNLEVINLLLDTGADPRAPDYTGNTPLHILAKNIDCSREMTLALLSAGAHLDALNDKGHSFQSLRALRGQQLHEVVNPVPHTSLQCLAARVIRQHGISYEAVLHPRLTRFVDIH
ncbi:protein fem-1 homolog A-like [Macrobrachium rosenbergii]|uniref:protein fem-1 homolog A-like n=1 Tax=Macrobrachium rosenbergii TaxID=79674 RepID=UPI0034D4DCFB